MKMWLVQKLHKSPEKKSINLYSNLNSQETDFWKFKTSSTSNCSYMFLFAVSIWEFIPDPLLIMYINCTYMSSDTYCIQSLIHMYIFKRGVHMWLFVSQCGHCGCGSRCLNCILLLFFRPWGRLCNCITYKLLCSVVTGCTCKCTVSEFPKTTNFS